MSMPGWSQTDDPKSHSCSYDAASLAAHNAAEQLQASHDTDSVT